MLIGIDLDNTILNYGDSIREAAKDVFGISLEGTGSKPEAKEAIVEKFGGVAWTDLQGRIYGEYSTHAKLFSGVLDFVSLVQAQGHRVTIISHKTRYAVSGGESDLRALALENLARLGLIAGPVSNTKTPEWIVFCDTKEDKVSKVREAEVDVFIDDLFEIVSILPASMQRFHIFCADRHSPAVDVTCVKNWRELGFFFS